MHVLSTPIEDGLALLDLEQGAYYSFNSTAAELWRLLENPKTAQALESSLSSTYEVSLERCTEQVALALSRLKSYGLIVQEFEHGQL